jgi:hypothetical protein
VASFACRISWRNTNMPSSSLPGQRLDLNKSNNTKWFQRPTYSYTLEWLLKLVFSLLFTCFVSPGHDIKLPTRRSTTTSTPSRLVTRKTDLYDSIDSTRTQPLRWLAIRVRLYAVIQDSHFNLVCYTLIQASL